MSERIVDVAYAAGFFDGEGHIRIQRHSSVGSYMLSVTAVQATPYPLDMFVALFGGTCKRRLMTYRGSPKCLYTWQASSKAAETALVEMLPHLRCKRDEALLALEFRATFRPQFGDRSRLDDAVTSARHDAMIALQEMRKDKRQSFVDAAVQERDSV